MKIIEDAWRREGELPRGGVATVGNFDGVHLGQRAVIDRVVARGRDLDAPALVVTFEPHPLELLRPASAPPRLTTRGQKDELLAQRGVDCELIVSFDEEFARTTAADFVDHFLFGALDLREIYVGRGFVFGRDRDGDLGLLARMAARTGRIAQGVEEVVLDGERVSSTRIRAAVERGDVELAARCLGRPYEISGQVVGGAGKGRGLGWPTINLESDNDLPPARGVYTTRVRIDGDRWPAVTNVGVRPTLHEDGRLTIETHILDLERDLYERRVTLEFDRRLRDERRFENVEDLVAQIEQDVRRAREILAGGANG